jgi:hypothetical protein
MGGALREILLKKRQDDGLTENAVSGFLTVKIS